MKIPIVNLGHGDVPESLPAVASVRVSGFLSCACPVLRVGTSKAWRLMLLVSHEDRTHLGRDLASAVHDASRSLESKWPLCPTDTCEAGYGAVAVRGSSGLSVAFHNAESLWVDARWLANFAQRQGAAYPLADRSHGTAMLIDCAWSAWALCGNYEGGRDVATRIEARQDRAAGSLR